MNNINYNNIVKKISDLFDQDILLKISISIYKEVKKNLIIKINLNNHNLIDFYIYNKIIEIVCFELNEIKLTAENIMICDENYVYEIKNNTFTYSSLYGKISHIPNDPDIFDEESYHLNNERIKKKLKSEHNLSEDQISKLFFQNSIKDYDTLEKSYRLRSSYSLTNSDLNILQEDPANESYEQTQFFSGESDIEPE
jgi:hypothetical protein